MRIKSTPKSGALCIASGAANPSLRHDLSDPHALLNRHGNSAARESAGCKCVISTKASEASLVQVEVTSSGIHRDGVDRTCVASVSVRDGHTLSTSALVDSGPGRSDHRGEVSKDIDKLCVL